MATPKRIVSSENPVHAKFASDLLEVLDFAATRLGMDNPAVAWMCPYVTGGRFHRASLVQRLVDLETTIVIMSPDYAAQLRTLTNLDDETLAGVMLVVWGHIRDNFVPILRTEHDTFPFTLGLNEAQLTRFRLEHAEKQAG